jgi:hypothetical protein
MIYETCSRCGNAIQMGLEGRLPLWCPRCGADFKPQLPPCVNGLSVPVARATSPTSVPGTSSAQPVLKYAQSDSA